MEITPELETTGEEISPEISSDETPPQDREEFDSRVQRLIAMMEDDPKIRDRLLAEIYVNIASAEMGIRQMAEAVQKQGIAGLMKGAFNRGG